MAGFSSYDDMISEVTTNGKQATWEFYKTGAASHGAGTWHSILRAAGSPGAMADPTTYVGYTNTTGTMNFTAQDPDRKILATFGGAATTNCTLMVYDMLGGIGGISLTSTGDKTISSTAFPRYVDGVGVQAWIETTVATATSACVLRMNSYTNTTPASGRDGATVTFPAAITVARSMFRLPLQAGDSGVSAINTINVGTAPTAGTCNLLVIRPLAFIPLIANIWTERDLVLQYSSMPRIYDGASLGLAYLASGTTATNFHGQIVVNYG